MLGPSDGNRGDDPEFGATDATTPTVQVGNHIGWRVGFRRFRHQCALVFLLHFNL